MSNIVSAEMLAMIDAQMSELQAKKTTYRTVKVELNDSWLVRFLPYQFVQPGQPSTSSAPFWLCTANHWILKRPYFCPRHSSPLAGGDPDAPCVLCDETEAMAESPDKAVRDAGFSASANKQWTMYCWVFSKDIKKANDIEVVGGEDRWLPWEFIHSKWSWEEFIRIFRQYGTRRAPVNVLDIVNGRNFWITGTTKGLTIRPDDDSALCDENGNLYTDQQATELFEYACSKIKPRTYTPLNDDQINAALVKLDEQIKQMASRSVATSRRSQARYGEASDDLVPQAPRRAPQATVPRAGVQPATVPQARVPQAAPSVPQAAPSVPRSQTSQTAPPIQVPRATVPRATVPRATNQVDATAAPVPRVAPPSVAVQRPQSVSDRIRNRAQAPTREELPARTSAVASTIEDADNVTNENTDPAPPADQMPIDPQDDQGHVDPSDGVEDGIPMDSQDAPPQVSASGEVAPEMPQIPTAGGSTRINSRLRSAISAAAARK